MSGGSMIGQLYARTHRAALAGVILASAGPCFRETVADPACALKPRGPLASRDHSEGDGEHIWEKRDAGWVFRRANGRALLVSPSEPDARMRRMMPAVWEFDSRAWLHEIHVPALVMGGSRDRVAPIDQVRRVHEGIPASDLAVISGGGHMPFVERPDLVSGAVRRFLRELTPR
jgi:pimeloyl-ACP methyl ester carboxylesterase